MFDISLDRRGTLKGTARGEIVIGEHRDEFLIEIGHWEREDYIRSWLRNAARVLEKGFGKFALSVTAPGQASYEIWPCWAKDGQAVLHRSYLLTSITCDFKNAQDFETPTEEDWLDMREERDTLRYFRCSLQDIAEFERRLRGGGLQ